MHHHHSFKITYICVIFIKNSITTIFVYIIGYPSFVWGKKFDSLIEFIVIKRKLFLLFLKVRFRTVALCLKNYYFFMFDGCKMALFRKTYKFFVQIAEGNWLFLCVNEHLKLANGTLWRQTVRTYGTLFKKSSFLVWTKWKIIDFDYAESWLSIFMEKCQILFDVKVVLFSHRFMLL